MGDGLIAESLEESAAAYTKATAKKCILEKVDVKTGEEAESNVLQVSVWPSPFLLDYECGVSRSNSLWLTLWLTLPPSAPTSPRSDPMQVVCV